MKRRITGLAIVVLALFMQQVLAAVPIASAGADRRAKQAIPPAGKALLYVYRLDDRGPSLSPNIWLNTFEYAGLAPRTFGYWAVKPGRLDLRAGTSGSRVTLRCQEGRIYFVRMTVAANGRADLRVVSYGSGRRDTSQARLIRDFRPSARPAPTPRPPSRQTGVTLILKMGSFRLGDGSQNILGAPLDFSSTATAWGLEGEWRIPSDFAFGLEVGSRSHSYTSVVPGASGDMQVTSVYVNAKKYFRATPIVQPYVGAGLGAATTKFSGGVTGSASGFAAQAMTGVAFRWERFGVYTELKYQSARTRGTNASTGASVPVDASGMGLYAGVDVHF
jgi:hypothetical protein